jgi:hypothetical protein
MMIILNLALPERTCYEPLASTHPDTQGIAEASFSRMARRNNSRISLITVRLRPIRLYEMCERLRRLSTRPGSGPAREQDLCPVETSHAFCRVSSATSDKS